MGENGISLLYPEGWKAREADTHIILTDQQDDFIGGSVYIPQVEEIHNLGGAPTPTHILEHVVIEHTDEMPLEIKTFTVDGREAASLYYSGEVDELYMVVHLRETYFVIMTFAAPKEQLLHFTPTARDMLASVEYQPQEE